MRMNVYIPDDLRKRMDRVAKKSDVNWSEIACRAFAEQCSILESRQRSVSNMKDVLERLRGVEFSERSKAEASGHTNGVAWAKKLATPSQLRLLYRASQRDPVHGLDFATGGGHYTAGQRFYFILNPLAEQASDRDAAYSFWCEVGASPEEDAVDSDFVNGFADGALSVWEAVKDEL